MSVTTPSNDRTNTDALRSMKRYVALALGDAWEIRLSREEGAFERPFARVWQVAGTTYPRTSSKWLADMVQPFVISAYPERGDTSDRALLAAQAVEEQMFQAFRRGIGDGRPFRIPLCDYSNTSLSNGAEWVTNAFMRVTDLSTQPFPDPDDDKLWTVVCDVRVTWRRPAYIQPEGPVLQELDLEGTGEAAGQDVSITLPVTGGTP